MRLCSPDWICPIRFLSNATRFAGRFLFFWRLNLPKPLFASVLVLLHRLDIFLVKIGPLIGIGGVWCVCTRQMGYVGSAFRPMLRDSPGFLFFLGPQTLFTSISSPFLEIQGFSTSALSGDYQGRLEIVLFPLNVCTGATKKFWGVLWKPN